MALAAPPQRSWRELLGGPSQYKQQQQLQRHAQHQERQSVAAAAAQADDEAVAANLDYVCPDKADRLMGWTEGNLPQVLQKCKQKGSSRGLPAFSVLACTTGLRLCTLQGCGSC
jgi:hypothetical protein